MINAVNLVAFQCGWFACVLGAAHQRPYAGVAAVAAIALAHVATAVRPRAELALLGLAAGIGATWDSLLAATGWVAYASGALVPGTAPLWIVALWVLFATALNRSLAWLKPRLALAAVLGAIGGPLAYVGGARLGALSFPHETAALIAQAIGWAALTPLLLRLAQRHDGCLREAQLHSDAVARHA
ncbi:MAG TPA: DUF2878 domain-containing protein [Casimicrobiaceae bacterium]|nr:DUF2878 domain-containing protein [Casimicrobiaceae bacterium]